MTLPRLLDRFADWLQRGPRTGARVQWDLHDQEEPPSTRRVRRLQREVNEHGLTRIGRRQNAWRRTFGPPLTADHWAGVIAFVVIASIFVGVLLVVMGVMAPIEPHRPPTPIPSSTSGPR